MCFRNLFFLLIIWDTHIFWYFFFYCCHYLRFFFYFKCYLCIPTPNYAKKYFQCTYNIHLPRTRTACKVLNESLRTLWYVLSKGGVCWGGDGVFNLTPSFHVNLEIIKVVLQPIWSPADTRPGQGIWKISRCRYLRWRVFFYCFIYNSSSSSPIIRIMSWTVQEINMIKK